MTNAEMANAILMDTLEERIDYLMSLIMQRDKEIAQLQEDNCSLVEQMNQMALKIEHKSGTAERSYKS